MISQRDRKILEDLAKRQLEIAKSDRMVKLKQEWLHSNQKRPDRPMVTIELRTFAGDVLPDLMECEGEEARQIEEMLRSDLVNAELFGDDTIVRDYLPVHIPCGFLPLGIPVEVERTAAGGLGHHFVEAIKDLEQDFHKLKKSEFGVDLDGAKKRCDSLNDILGHILPARLSGRSYNVSITQNLIHIMSMETFLFAMFDYPDLFHKMMTMLTDDYAEHIKLMEEQKAFLPTCADEPVCQGTYAFTDEISAEPGTAKCSWFYLDSQETVGISPDMFCEFIFPYYKKIMDKAGPISYGCCEPVDPFWDSCLSKVENLRKVSISPWCNEEFMAEKLRGTKVVYHRKPSPNFIGVGTSLDEAAVREHISKTVKLNRGQSLEFTQRDVYTIHKDIGKVKRYVEIIREECVSNW